MTSEQTLSDAERRSLAQWAADCAERVFPLFEGSDSAKVTLQDALDRTRAYSVGEADTATEISKRFGGGRVASEARSLAGAAAARAIGQASAVAHMGAHSLGAAGYAVNAVVLAHPGEPDKQDSESAWQLAHLTEEQRDMLRKLPQLGTDRSGPLGPGLLTQGVVGETIREIQRRIGHLSRRVDT